MDELDSMLDAPDFEVSPVKGGAVKELASQLDGEFVPTVSSTAEQAAKHRENEMVQNQQARELLTQRAGEEASWQKTSRDMAREMHTAAEPVVADCKYADEQYADEPNRFKLEPAPSPITAVVQEMPKQVEAAPQPPKENWLQQPVPSPKSSPSFDDSYGEYEEPEPQDEEGDDVLDMLKGALQGLNTGAVYTEDASPPKPVPKRRTAQPVLMSWRVASDLLRARAEVSVATSALGLLQFAHG